MTENTNQSLVQIGRSEKFNARLGMGGSFYGLDHASAQGEADILAAMETALDKGITHFDTASGYGNGYSERLIGRFMAADSSRRERIFLASKFASDDISAQAMIKAIDASRDRLQTDMIDLYYIHWPRTGKDLRPLMEGLETARQQGKIQAIGVSNFSVEQMAQLGEVGRIDAHQLGYNLLWRYDEADIIPYCVENNISVVVYSALAHGILAGKYARELDFVKGDQRWSITLFRDSVWPRIYEALEDFKALAEQTGYPLTQLAIQWLLHQRGITSVLVGAKNKAQALANVQALQADIPDSVFNELTALSDQVSQYIPDEGNPFGYHP
ncbi:MAG: aldo/keto reductase [Anaerolineaceae bacterium]|nr:aldo/keto reductase [Anaerolineaceae bacterium]